MLLTMQSRSVDVRKRFALLFSLQLEVWAAEFQDSVSVSGCILKSNFTNVKTF